MPLLISDGNAMLRGQYCVLVHRCGGRRLAQNVTGRMLNSHKIVAFLSINCGGCN